MATPFSPRQLIAAYSPLAWCCAGVATFGALVATFLPDVLHFEPYQAQLVYGLLLVLIIVVLPTGVTGALRQYYFRAANWVAAHWS